MAGIALGALGVLLLLDRLEAVDMGFAEIAPALCVVIGVILLSLGLSRRD